MTTAELAGSVRIAPRWWCDGVRTRLWWSIALAAVLIHGVIVANLVRNHADLGYTVCWAIGPLSETVVGLLFWMWRPRNILGPVLLGMTGTWQLNALPVAFPGSRAAWTVFLLAGWSAAIFLAAASIVFPTGRAWARRAWLFVAGWAIWVPMAGIPQVLFWEVPYPSYLHLGSWPGLVDYLRVLGGVAFAMQVSIIAMLFLRIARTTRGVRWRVVPYLGVAIAQWGISTLINFSYMDGNPFGPYPHWFQTYFLPTGTLAGATAAAVGLLAVERRRSTSVADLVVAFEDLQPGKTRDALARAIGDPGLELGLWLPDQELWIDENGQPIALPPEGDTRRAITPIGDQLAVIVHDRDIIDQPRLLQAAGAAARLALENERLHAELRSRITELRDSRARILSTADAERRKLEEQLRDGAHGTLEHVDGGLDRLAEHVDTPDGHELLRETRTELDAAITELNDLARGIHPAVLTDHGLAAAIEAIAARMPIAVETDIAPGRLPAHVETAAYYVAAEALTNITRYANPTHARITSHLSGNQLELRITDDGNGGADPGRGTGLAGLHDRIAILDGHLHIDSPPGGGTTLTARIPLYAPDR